MNVLIYGAGEAGAQIADYCKTSNIYQLIGFVDDNPALHGKSVKGTQVYPPKSISKLIQDFSVKEIFIAIPSAGQGRYQEILKNLSLLDVHLRTLPRLNEINNGRVNLDDIKEINIEDLLLRAPIEPLQDLLTQNVQNKVVLITGGGGSIGGELCRQIIKLKPKHLIVVDHSEFNLYSISAELNAIASQINYPNSSITPLLCSVSDEMDIRSVIGKYLPDTLFHAAAYKHVGIVQKNIVAGIKNNIFGTLNAAKAAIDFNVTSFMLISTDKAVRPSSIMGATKRISEMILQALASLEFQLVMPHKTCFSIVRFGNVLGSSGSVVPIFKEQIRKGGPVTVTHPDVTRYFMTIKEAAQLVIQASSLAKGGDLFLLDMGEPVKIYDLAKNMIRLSGGYLSDRNSESNGIEIIFTGLTSGEKLYEEFLISGSLKKTIHPKILTTNERFMFWNELNQLLNEIRESIFDEAQLLNLLTQIVPYYTDR
jgi:FlaA1/EpsC-like NDP-sugar epimerase